MSYSCGVCRIPLTGGLDTFGDSSMPRCFNCNYDIGVIPNARNDAYEVMAAQESFRFIPESADDLGDVDANAEALTFAANQRNLKIEAGRVTSYFEEARYWAGFNRHMAGLGINRGVEY